MAILCCVAQKAASVAQALLRNVGALYNVTCQNLHQLYKLLKQGACKSRYVLVTDAKPVNRSDQQRQWLQ
jgi:hypothetical protein